MCHEKQYLFNLIVRNTMQSKFKMQMKLAFDNTEEVCDSDFA